MSFKVGVVAHFDRLAQAETLASTVDADYVNFDDGTLTAEGNHRKVWEWMCDNAPDNSWAVVLEDDAEPVEGFRTQLGLALEVAPAPIVSLYLGRKRPPHWQNQIQEAIHHAEQEEACFIVTPWLLHAVAVAIWTPLLPAMLKIETALPWDQHITHWARRQHKPVCYTVPSLVEHGDGDTLVQHSDGDNRTPGRVAWNVGTRRHWSSSKVVM